MEQKFIKYLSGRCICVIILSGVLLLVQAVLLALAFWGERIFWWAACIQTAAGALAVWGFYRWYLKPYKETEKILKLFADGYLFRDFFQLKYPVSPQMERAGRKIKEMLDHGDMINISKKQAEYLALQNQINPHFLYNTLEGLRSEALLAGMDQVAEMTEALATFFRYTISHMDHLATLEDELANIENYYIIQQFRFGQRLKLEIKFDYEEEFDVLQYRLPKLTLQPIVENAVFHGIERKIGPGLVCIRIQPTTTRLIILVSDDGLGIEKEALQSLNLKLQKMAPDVAAGTYQKEGIAIVNVNNRIKLLFGEEYGIHMYSTRGAGTDVEVTLPLLKE